MIIILKGGLGNQLFQYALGENLHRKGYEILYSKSGYNQDVRNFSLDYFNANCVTLNSDQERKMEKVLKVFENPFSNKPGLYNRIMRKLYVFFIQKIYLNNVVKKEIPGSLLNLDHLNKNSILDGYWGNKGYFLNIKEFLQFNIMLKENYFNATFINYLEQIRNEENSVSVHVRRGDYLNPNNLSIFHKVELSYFIDSMNLIKSKVKNCTFYIFSDDIDWCKNNMNQEGLIFVKGSDLEDFHDFSLMKECRHNIISNSTFSWWAAFLNKNKSSIKIAPKKWYSSSERQELHEKKTGNESDFIRI